MRDVPEAAVAFGIFDVETGNQVGSFTSFERASEALAALVDDDHSDARSLILTFFDKDGKAIGSRLAEELLPL